MIKISAVSYLNTFPFIYGLIHSELINKCEISKDVPAICAEKLLNGKVDLGLVPVAIIPQLTEYEVISDYCIGADGKVDTVLLLSNKPLSEITSVYLDFESRTSVQLVKVLAKNYWKISPKWENINSKNITEEFESVVLIGDKTFTARYDYKYMYDLAEEWKKFTDLPFVFACWVANKKLDEGFKSEFNSAIKSGVEQIDETIAYYKDKIPQNVDAKEYFTTYISYDFDDKKREGMKKFLDFLK